MNREIAIRASNGETTVAVVTGLGSQHLGQILTCRCDNEHIWNAERNCRSNYQRNTRASHEDDLEVSLATFIELFLVEERVSFDRERAVTAILELATYEGDPNVVYQASENIDEGLNTFDAFHAALSGGSIISSDGAYDDLGGVERVQFEPDENENSTA